MNEHKYILEPYKGMNTRYRCPSCQQRDKTFSLYIDAETGEHLHPSVGRCNRESNCGYHYTPKQYFQDNNISFDTPQPKAYKPRPVTPQPKPVSFIPVEVFKASLKGHEANHFVKFLIDLFGVEVAGELVSRYFIGTSKHWNGATVFWQIDTHGKIRTGKIMLYSPTTGKRQKEFTFAHKLIKQPEFGLKQCFFGEHLLIDKTKPVAIVESEKTAVIASVYLPQFIWVASSGLHGLNIDKCSILKGRTVTLFPDLSKPKIEGKPTAFEIWSSKVKELSQLANFTVSDLLERKATEAEMKQGFDLADYLIRYDYTGFLEPGNLIKPDIEKLTEVKVEQPPAEPLVEVKPFEQPEPVYYFSKPGQPKPERGEQDITELENYFAGIAIPTQQVKLNAYSTITDCSLFIESHFATVKANNGKRTFLPYLNRLQELKQVLTANLN
ncbi:DUF6371 domain-containing protein [Agriterribacter sp.]|uniref:DUF6965 family protein n=1 Tax=Agriterribacter sp. TaxID=2821509 RepID=UPI002BADE224|nr:DUF6371 domain-containing protein [Agriterribacter sp.]HRP55234.1 DUF6371 domain-containing protein [Agriterribacter sp.]